MISVQLEGLEQAISALRSAPERVRKGVVKVVAKKVLDDSKARTARQTDVSGIPFAPHKRGRTRKMLIRLARRMKVLSVNETEAIIGFGNGFERMIAARQQFGYTQNFNSRQFSSNETQSMTAPATRRQAKSLIEAGFKTRRSNGRGTATPTLRWIINNMNIGQAGAALRYLRNNPKTEWKTTLPPRAFLGVSAAEITELTTLALQTAQHSLAQTTGIA